MAIIADIMLAAGAIGAAFYCFVLGRRLRRFNDLEKGVGGAVAVLSAQVDDLDKTLASARSAAESSAQMLEDLTARAEDVRRQLELQMAALHDVVPSVASPEEEPEVTSNSAPGPAETTPVTKPAEPMFTRHRKAS